MKIYETEISKKKKAHYSLATEHNGILYISTRNDILMCRIYTPDIDFWDEIDDEYALFFGEHKPARVVVPTNKLHFGCLLEIEATAILDRKF